MERLGKNFIKIRTAARAGLNAFQLEPGERIIVAFESFPAMDANPYKIALVEDVQGQHHALLRKWDSVHDFKRWANGKLNFNHLKIIAEKKSLSAEKTQQFLQTLQQLADSSLPEGLKKQASDVAEPKDWQLDLHTEQIKGSYHWGASYAAAECFAPLVGQLKTLFLQEIKRPF